MRAPHLSVLAAVAALGWRPAAGNLNERYFVDAPDAISFTDPLKNGFRVILSDGFVQRLLKPLNSFPTIYVTAIPLNQFEERYTKIIYPDTPAHAITGDNKQILIDGLRERSWYFVCIEWHSLNRRNETIGCVCKLYRTLDSSGGRADSVLTDVRLAAANDVGLTYTMRAAAFDGFPVRLTAYMSGGRFPAPAQTFYLDAPGDLEVTVGSLRPDTVYGQLCVVEEPLPQVARFTAMGRHVGAISIKKCYGEKTVKTRPAHIESPWRDGRPNLADGQLLNNDIRAYKHTMNAATAFRAHILLALTAIVFLRFRALLL